ncbi:MAG: Nif3-like dinuclear metal center hexameric protein [Bacteroidota bacterium]|jgi:dinuclear metal center YbgI/SA1388 family protein|nr:Nif3-like dinuclear metal center hexameric protein [Bacteroidota bacterium]
MWNVNICECSAQDHLPVQIDTFAIIYLMVMKLKLREITSHLESIAPLAYQESYDNAGLICGEPDMEITGALICLDSIESVIDEAISLNCNLVIAHHPIVFSGLKKFNGKNYVERVIIKAIRNNIAIYAAHTNLDNIPEGVNGKIAEKLGLKNCRILIPAKDKLKRLITFCPDDKAEVVRKALFNAGAGAIGDYDECSFNTSGTGTFKAGKNADPYVGKPGEQHHEKETKIETILPSHLENRVLSAMIKAHPYEEVAYDLIPLHNHNQYVGGGIIGEITEMDEMAFLQLLKREMKADCIRYTALRDKKVRKVAVCGGSGSFMLKDAMRSGADVFVTADFKYHQFFDAENQLVIADVGHYESEQFTAELFYDILKKKFSTFALHLSKINTNPINYL